MALRRRDMTCHLQKLKSEHDKRQKLLKYAQEHNAVRENMRLIENNSEKVEELRLLKWVERQERERLMEESMLKAEEKRRQIDASQEQEEKLAKQLEELKLKEEREERMRQHLRKNCFELRELEAKLQAGYMNRERAAQLAEKEALKVEELKQKEEIAKVMQVEYERAQLAEYQKSVEKQKEKFLYQQDLERQLEEKEQKKQDDFENTLKEKLMVDEIVRKIYEEDRREEELKTEKQQATRRFIEEFKIKREEWKKLECERLEGENKEILKFFDLQQQRENEKIDILHKQEVARSEVQKQISNYIVKEEQEKEEQEQIRLDLYLEEQKEADKQKELEEIEKKLRTKTELLEMQKQQLELKEFRIREHAREEAEFRKQMLAKFAEDDRIEQMNAQRCRMKQLEHKRSVELLIESRRQEYEAAQERKVVKRREEEALRAMQKQMIEKERRALLQEHAPKLLGYLPKGVIRDEDDLKLLDQSFQKVYQTC